VAQAEEVKTVMLKAQRITPEAFAPFGQVRALAHCFRAASVCAANAPTTDRPAWLNWVALEEKSQWDFACSSCPDPLCTGFAANGRLRPM